MMLYTLPHNAMHSPSMYKNSNTLLGNIALWHYLDTEHLDFRCENNGTPRVAINQRNMLSYIH